MYKIHIHICIHTYKIIKIIYDMYIYIYKLGIILIKEHF